MKLRKRIKKVVCGLVWKDPWVKEKERKVGEKREGREGKRKE
jgi:hypothetical protein